MNPEGLSIDQSACTEITIRYVFKIQACGLYQSIRT